ncbi:MAG: aspartate-semialdehyde dehydrogenase [Acidobacteriota bacterium]|nr:aspartate-semialdehyde dehydrogenase [Acidobacteriota bacterium]
MIPVGVLGATGLVGQHLVSRLSGHPWFRVAWVGASERSAGRRYGDVPWRIDAARPDGANDLRLELARPGRGPALMFSALDAAAADTIEPAMAQAGHVVISNARSFRMRHDVPLVVPEINAGHLQWITRQPWRGAIITNPNCSTTFLALALAPLARFGITAVTVSTLQALSGAGHLGVAGLDALGNVLPFIDGEEEKLESETLKILEGAFPVSAQATRVPVVHGHTLLISVGLSETVPEAGVREAWRAFRGNELVRALPGSPASPLEIVEGRDRPQPRLDLDRGGGMAVSIGRLRACRVLGWRFVALGHNLVRGAAGAAVLNAELAVASGAVDAGGARAATRSSASS